MDIEEIRKRHKAIIFIDWEKEYDPEWQPVSLGNAQQCHLDRAALLKRVDELEEKYALECSAFVEMEIKYENMRFHAELLESEINAVKNCVNYETTIEVNGKQVKTACFLKDQVLAKLGMSFKERYDFTKKGAISDPRSLDCE